MKIEGLIDYTNQQKHIIKAAHDLGLNESYLLNPDFDSEQLKSQFTLLRMNIDYVIDPQDKHWKTQVDKKLNSVRLDLVNRLDLDREEYNMYGLEKAFRKRYNITEEIKEVTNEYMYFLRNQHPDEKALINICHYYPEIIGIRLHKLNQYTVDKKVKKDALNDYYIDSILNNKYNENVRKYLDELVETEHMYTFSDIIADIKNEQRKTGRVEMMLDERYTKHKRNEFVSNYYKTGVDFRLLPEGTTLEQFNKYSKEEKQEYRRLSNEWRHSTIQSKERQEVERG